MCVSEPDGTAQSREHGDEAESEAVPSRRRSSSKLRVNRLFHFLMHNLWPTGQERWRGAWVGVGVGGVLRYPLCIIHERLTYGTSKLHASASAVCWKSSRSSSAQFKIKPTIYMSTVFQ